MLRPVKIVMVFKHGLEKARDNSCTERTVLLK